MCCRSYHSRLFQAHESATFQSMAANIRYSMVAYISLTTKDGPCVQSYERVLQRYHVCHQQYHGGAFTGNHVHRILQHIDGLVDAPRLIIASHFSDECPGPCICSRRHPGFQVQRSLFSVLLVQKNRHVSTAVASQRRHFDKYRT